MSRKTYEVNVTAIATRKVKVRAGSPREAMEVAEERIQASMLAPGAWTLGFGGTPDEHYSVFLDDAPVGPWGDGTFDDEDPDDEEVTA